MRSLPIRLAPGDEALELRDIGARDCTPTGEPLGSVLTWTDVDTMADTEAARPAGYVDAVCLGCGCALFVPETQRAGDILCPGCQRAGEALAATAEGVGPVGRFCGLALYPDADLIDAIARVDNSRFSHSEWVGIDATNRAAPDEAHPTIPGYALRTPQDKEAFLDAATAVLLRRMDTHGGSRAAA